MKKTLILLTAGMALSLASCKDFLGIEPEDKISPKEAFKDPSAVRSAMATLYLSLPVEDFNYNPQAADGFNFRAGGNGMLTSFMTDESLHSLGSNILSSVGPVGSYWGDNSTWGAYMDIRRVNTLMEMLPQVPGLSPDDLNIYMSECHFLRAYMYFGLVKRYGGVPIITHPLTPNENLYIPRNTEKESWNFVLDECDRAIEHLPASWSPELGAKRATVWAAYALKSRAALHAASVAKYWMRAQLIGEAVELGLVGGMTQEDASGWYGECIEACSKIIDESGKSLYKPDPQSIAEAITNYQGMFENPSDASVEVIYSKAFVDGSITGNQGHSMDIYYQPAQTNSGYFMFGRFNPTLDLVDLYEDYTDDGTGKSAKLVTRTGGVSEDEYIANPQGVAADLFVNYREYDDPSEIYADKDARFHASILYSGSNWRNTDIVIQGGLITQDKASFYVQDQAAVGDRTYYTFGAAGTSDYSGFDKMGNISGANYTSTGFSLRKFLNSKSGLEGKLNSCTTEFIDFRLAEIYLNYAEAVVESSLGDAAKAKQYLNAIRKRAGHSDEIDLSLENVLKERRVELAFEGHRYWDLIRRREFHTEFNNRIRKSLVPAVDLRSGSPKYIFIRVNNYYDNGSNGMTFQNRSYYLGIPGIGANKLIQNPQY